MEKKDTLVSEDSLTPRLRSMQGGIDITDPLKPYLGKHKYKYDCTFLDHPLLDKNFAADIAYALMLRLGKLQKHKQRRKHPHFIEIEKFWSWMLGYLTCVDKPFTRAVKQSFSAGETPDRENWQKVVDSFRSSAVRRKDNPFSRGNKNSRNCYIDIVRGFLDVCETRGVFPRAILRGIKNAHKDKGRRKILGDLVNRHLDKAEVKRLIGDYLQDRVNVNDIIEDERVACINALASSGLDITGLTDAEILEEIKRLNTERLAEVRRCAEADFIKGWETYQEGQQLLEECDLSYKEDMLRLMPEWFKVVQDDPGCSTVKSRQNHFRELFWGPTVREKPKGPRRVGRLVRQPLPERVAKSRLLTLLDGRYGHGPHFVKRGQGVVEVPIESMWRNTFKAYGQEDNGGWAKVRLGMSFYTMLMAQIILLIDTGLNTEVIDNLTVDCVKDTDIPAIKEIWGIKARAGNKPVVGTVRLDEGGHLINSIEVIQWVREMTQRLRHIAKNGHPLFEVRRGEPGIEKKLFIREKICDVPKDGIQDLVAGCFAVKGAAIKRFKKEHPSIGAYNFTMASIRPTVRILAFMNGEAIETSRVQMNHVSVGTTSGYVVRTMSRMEMEVRIREFMKHYEAIVIQDISGAAEKLGYTSEEYEKHLTAAQRTGLGTICDHLRKDSEGNEFSLKQKDCDPVEDCLDCPLARVFPALKENIVDAYMMRNWIRANEVELRANEERWRMVWMRWLAIAEGVIDKAQTAHSVSRKILREAEEMAEELGIASFLFLV